MNKEKIFEDEYDNGQGRRYDILDSEIEDEEESVFGLDLEMCINSYN